MMDRLNHNEGAAGGGNRHLDFARMQWQETDRQVKDIEDSVRSFCIEINNLISDFKQRKAKNNDEYKGKMEKIKKTLEEFERRAKRDTAIPAETRAKLGKKCLKLRETLEELEVKFHNLKKEPEQGRLDYQERSQQQSSHDAQSSASPDGRHWHGGIPSLELRWLGGRGRDRGKQERTHQLRRNNAGEAPGPERLQWQSGLPGFEQEFIESHKYRKNREKVRADIEKYESEIKKLEESFGERYKKDSDHYYKKFKYIETKFKLIVSKHDLLTENAIMQGYAQNFTEKDRLSCSDSERDELVNKCKKINQIIKGIQKQIPQQHGLGSLYEPRPSASRDSQPTWNPSDNYNQNKKEIREKIREINNYANPVGRTKEVHNGVRGGYEDKGKWPKNQEQSPYYYYYCPFSRYSASSTEFQQELKQLEKDCCPSQDGSQLQQIDVGTQLGNYSLVEKLGKGNSGQVFLAEVEGSEGKVAVKVLDPKDRGICQGDVKYFCKEIKNMASLDHKNIVPLLGFGKCGKVPFLVMEYIPGRTLKDKLLEGKRWGQTELVKTMEQICDGVEYMHKGQLMHKDLKPENILLGKDNQAVICDLGVAAHVETPEAKKFCGDFKYVPPEQLIDENCYQSDVYTLGLIAFELHTGKNLIDYMAKEYKEQIETMLEAWRRDDANASMKDNKYLFSRECEKYKHKWLREKVPEWLNKKGHSMIKNGKIFSVLKCALEPNPKERYQTPMELSRDLHTAVRQSLDPSERRKAQEDTGTNPSDDRCKALKKHLVQRSLEKWLNGLQRYVWGCCMRPDGARLARTAERRRG
jgi:serine/threonine protein kinase